MKKKENENKEETEVKEEKQNEEKEEIVQEESSSKDSKKNKVLEETKNQPEKENNEKQFKVKKNESKNADKEFTQKKKKTGLTIIIIIALIIFLALALSVTFSLLNMNNDKIISGVSILDIDVSNLTAEQAEKQINDAINSRFQDENNNLILKRNDEETNVTANTFNAKFDVNKAVAEAYNIGRKGNIITDNYEILFTKLFKKNIKAKLYLDEELLNTTITDVSSKMQDAVIENSYYIEDEKLIIVKGKAGYIINNEELKNKIYSQLGNIHTIYKEPDPIDLEKIRNEIYKEPQDAYVEKNPTQVHPHVNGIDFAISIEEAKKLLEEDKEEYTIPLKITVPKKTINNLGAEAFPDLLATFSTTYDASNRNRSTKYRTCKLKS